MRAYVMILPLLVLAACGNYDPVEKTATVNTATGQLVLPHPCPDWSRSSVHNYGNSNHSNYGCAVNNNLAVQLEDPWDLIEARPDATNGGPSDIEMQMRTIQQYRAGEIPIPLEPLQSSDE